MMPGAPGLPARGFDLWAGHLFPATQPEGCSLGARTDGTDDPSALLPPPHFTVGRKAEGITKRRVIGPRFTIGFRVALRRRIQYRASVPYENTGGTVPPLFANSERLVMGPGALRALPSFRSQLC